MKRLPPIFPRTATLFPYTTRFRSNTGRALRRRVSADLALARSAMGRALAWVAVAIVFGASAWLLVMGVLTALLHSLGLSWLASFAICAALSLGATGFAAWRVSVFFGHAGMHSPPRPQGPLRIGAEHLADEQGRATCRERWLT